MSTTTKDIADGVVSRGGDSYFTHILLYKNQFDGGDAYKLCREGQYPGIVDRILVWPGTRPVLYWVNA